VCGILAPVSEASLAMILIMVALSVVAVYQPYLLEQSKMKHKAKCDEMIFGPWIPDGEILRSQNEGFTTICAESLYRLWHVPLKKDTLIWFRLSSYPRRQSHEAVIIPRHMKSMLYVGNTRKHYPYGIEISAWLQHLIEEHIGPTMHFHIECMYVTN